MGVLLLLLLDVLLALLGLPGDPSSVLIEFESVLRWPSFVCQRRVPLTYYAVLYLHRVVEKQSPGNKRFVMNADIISTS